MRRRHRQVLVLAFATACLAAAPPVRAETCPEPPGTPQQPPVCTPGEPGCDGSPNGALLNHFQCYGLRGTRIDRRNVTLVDRYNSLTGQVCRLQELCVPADKDGEDPDAPDHPGTLTSYRIRRVDAFERVDGQTVTNQFGSVTVNLVAPRALLVPTALGLDGPPGSPDGAFPDGSPGGAFLDHFTCYDVRGGGNAGGPRTVTVQTRFEIVEVQVQKPWRLCVPTDKNGESPGAGEHANALLCYRTRSRGSIGRPQVFLANQFGDVTAQADQRRQLCVPSTVEGGGVPTTSTTTMATTTTSSTTTSTPATSTTADTATSTSATSTSSTSPTSSTPTSSTTTTTEDGSPLGAFL